MTDAHGKLFWGELADSSLNNSFYYNDNSAVDVLEISENGSKRHFQLDDNGLNSWLESSASSERPKIRILFVDEDAVHTEKLSVLKSDPQAHAVRTSKRILGWSYMTVWVAAELEVATTTVLITHNDLVQGVTERVIEENRWVSTHWPGRPQIGNEALLWRQECDAIDEVLQNHLANLKTWGRYARLAEGRARIGVDEVSFSLLFLGYRARTAKLMLYWTKCRAAIAQHDAESNLKLAEETKFLTQNSKADSRSLTRLQYLAMISLPLSLSSSIFGMGFFSTSTGPSGEPRLLVSPRWWYYLALAVPMTALTVVALYFMVAWEALRERSRRSNVIVEEKEQI
ncbi:MAG: hypothetical protein Q9201_000514 [Fulgogasparrea decipioides]